MSIIKKIARYKKIHQVMKNCHKMVRENKKSY